MITGDELRDARSRAGLTQEQLANQLSTTLRTIGNWERGSGVPKNREAAVKSLLGDYLGDQPSNPLAAASDMDLLAELGRRLARAERADEVSRDMTRGAAAGQEPADEDPATDDQPAGEVTRIPRPKPLPDDLAELAADRQDGPTAQEADEELQRQRGAGEDNQDPEI